MKEKVIIDKTKVINYLLNINHPEGRSKAMYFYKNGFKKTKSSQFQNALKSHFLSNQKTAIKIETSFGTKILINGPLETPNKETVFIKSVWFKEMNSEFIKLVTAYPSND